MIKKGTLKRSVEHNHEFQQKDLDIILDKFLHIQ